MWYRTVGCIVTLILSLLVVPRTAEAQQSTHVYRIGRLTVSPPPEPNPSLEAFRQGLRELGYLEGHNLVIESRDAAGQPERLPALAAELVRLPVEVLVASTTVAVRAAKQATGTLPIVMAHGGYDPVAAGLVDSLARPGGNVTGIALGTCAGFYGKWVELLKETLPQVSRVAMLVDTVENNQRSLGITREMERVALAVGLQIDLVEARDAPTFADAFAAMTRAGVEGLIQRPSIMFARERRRLVELAAQHRLPAIYELRQFVEAGGLMSYGPNLPALSRRAATYVARLLQGTPPADLPVEQPTQFELVLNLKTAKALGITFPPMLLFQADEVIQ